MSAITPPAPTPKGRGLFVAAGADGKKDREALVDPGLATFSCRNPTDIS
jgi:hypothetical protein